LFARRGETGGWLRRRYTAVPCAGSNGASERGGVPPPTPEPPDYDWHIPQPVGTPPPPGSVLKEPAVEEKAGESSFVRRGGSKKANGVGLDITPPAQQEKTKLAPPPPPQQQQQQRQQRARGSWSR